LEESKVQGQLQTNEIRAKLQQLAKVPALGKKLRGRENERETHTHTHTHI
jgi:hypothetical protein